MKLICLVIAALLVTRPPHAFAADLRAGADVTLLGALSLQAADHSGFEPFQVGLKGRLLNVTATRATILVGSKTYVVPKAVASYYFEAVDAQGAKYVLGDAWDQLAKLNSPEGFSCANSPTQRDCPWKSPVPWTDRKARQAALVCPIQPAPIVERGARGSYDPNCREHGNEPMNGPSWASCAPPPECSPAESDLKRKTAKQRLVNAKQKCTHQSLTHFPVQREAKCLVPFNQPITTLVVHHTETNPLSGAGEVVNDHLARGWDDVGYHYIIAPDATGKWKIFEGRPRKYIGAHAGDGANNDSLGIAITGCYKTNERPTATHPCAGTPRPPAEAEKLLVNLVARLKKEVVDENGKPTIKQITGHGNQKFARTHCCTACPSPACQMLVNRMQERFFGGGTK